MAEETDNMIWTAVIARSLALLCLDKMATAEPDRFKDTLARVDFLEALGLPPKDAAIGAGSTAASAAELKRLRRKQEEAASGKKAVKKKSGKR